MRRMNDLVEINEIYEYVSVHCMFFECLISGKIWRALSYEYRLFSIKKYLKKIDISTFYRNDKFIIKI